MVKEKAVLKRDKHGLVIAVIGLICLFIFAYDVLIIGNVVYAFKWIGCGRQPILIRQSVTLFSTEPESTIIYKHPGFFQEKTGLLQPGHPRLSCTDSRNIKR